VPKSLEQVRTQLALGEFDFSRHALRRVVERNISEPEIRQAGPEALAIETYPDDKYSPSLLLLGFTEERIPLHIQVSLADTPLVRIVTIYEPDPNEWIDYSIQR
jgi:hypothetical protein